MTRYSSLARLPVRLRHCSVRGAFWTVLDRLLSSQIGPNLGWKGKQVSLRLRGVPEPFYLRLGTTDWMVLDELFIAREYDRLNGFDLGQVRRIVDLGANVGYSVRLWDELFPGAQVVAVEPDQENARLCALNTSPLGARITNVQAFVGAAPGTARIDRSQGEWGIRMAAGGDREAAGESVPVMTMPGLLDAVGWSNEIDLLKCDIEGAEEAVFADCGGWIGRVRNLLVELHGNLTPANFAATLEKNAAGFEYYVLQEGADYSLVFLRARSPGID